MDAKRRNITAPPDWWKAFESAAAKDGQTLSEWVRNSAAVRLPRSVYSKLSEPRVAHRPKTRDNVD